MKSSIITHQYIDRATAAIKTEKLYYDKVVDLIYSTIRERSQVLFKLLTSAHFSSLLSFINYDFPFGRKISGGQRFLNSLGINKEELLDDINSLNSARKIFERKIKYWQYRPMPEDDRVIVSPADAKCIIGSFRNESQLFIKEKFFKYAELLGEKNIVWLNLFDQGDFAIFRLTPDKYHYNHTPVSGKVIDIYEIDGAYNSCNPTAVITTITPYSKNKRIVTIFDTNVKGGSQVGYVAMIEIVALMIGDIKQCYSEEKYDNPQKLKRGMFVKKGQPKSLYKPGSSVDVLIFQKDAIFFADDLLTNVHKKDIATRFSESFKRPLVETDIMVRSKLATARV